MKVRLIFLAGAVIGCGQPYVYREAEAALLVDDRRHNPWELELKTDPLTDNRGASVTQSASFWDYTFTVESFCESGNPTRWYTFITLADGRVDGEDGFRTHRHITYRFPGTDARTLERMDPNLAYVPAMMFQVNLVGHKEGALLIRAGDQDALWSDAPLAEIELRGYSEQYLKASEHCKGEPG